MHRCCKGFQDLSLTVGHVENVVLTGHQGAALMSALDTTAGKLSTFLIAHDLFTPQATHLLDAAMSGATAAIEHLDGHVLTVAEGEGLISQSLRIGAAVGGFVEHPHPLSASLFNQYVTASAPPGGVAASAADAHSRAAAITLAAPHAACGRSKPWCSGPRTAGAPCRNRH